MLSLTFMEIHLIEILPNFYSPEILFFARVKYNPLPLSAGVLIFGLNFSFALVLAARYFGSDGLVECSQR